MTDEASQVTKAERVNSDQVQVPGILVDLLDRPDKNVRVKAAIALAMMGSEGVPPSSMHLPGEAEINRRPQQRSISRFGLDAVEPVINTIRDSRREIVTVTVSVIGKLGDLRAVPVRISILEKQDQVTVTASAEALGYLEDRKAVEALIIP